MMICFLFISPPLCAHPLIHSCLSAMIGSTFVALLAGIQQASNATEISNRETRMNVGGSVVLTPNSSCFMTRVSASDPPRPKTTPTTINLRPSTRTTLTTSRRCAPRAMRTPISCVRSDIEKEITPYNPIAVRSIATPAKTPINTVW